MVNPPDVDEFSDVARVTGLKGVYRESRIHALNQKEIGIRYADRIGKKYNDLNLIICHIGGGVSVTAHAKGRMVDSNDIANDDEDRRSGRSSWHFRCPRSLQNDRGRKCVCETGL